MRERSLVVRTEQDAMNSMIFAPYRVIVLAERESKPDLGGRLRLSRPIWLGIGYRKRRVFARVIPFISH